MADTSVTYVGDGAQVNYTVPFPYILAAHVIVTVNEVVRLNPLDYVFTSATVIQFVTAPATNDAIRFQRVTPGDTRLVDFQAGAVLTEADLDLSANQNFYLSQEAKEGLTDLINAESLRIATALGIIETDPDAILAAMVTTALDTAAAAELQQRVTDIDDNAESILQVEADFQTQIDTMISGIAIYVQDEPPVPGVAGIPDPIADGARWYDSNDSNRPNLWDQATLAWLDLTDPNVGVNAAAITAVEASIATAEGNITANASGITVLDATVITLDGDITANATAHTSLNAEVDTNTADITTEQTTRANADTAMASDISLIGVANGGDTAFIIDSNTVQIDNDGTDTLNTILARHAVAIDVNGYVTGYELLNDGTVSTFNILVDKFQIVHASTVWAANTAYNLNDFVRPTTPTDPSRVFKVTTAGTSHATTEPTWDTTIDNTNNDNTVVWTTKDDGALSPFTVEAGNIIMAANVIIDGNLLVTGTVTGAHIGNDELDSQHLVDDCVGLEHVQTDAIVADNINVGTLAAVSADMGSLTAGDIVLNATGFIRAGQTAYDTGTGFYLGNDGGTHKFSIGDAGANTLTWDGTTLLVKGNVRIGSYVASDNIQLSADTIRTQTLDWTEVKKFEVSKTGTVRFNFDIKMTFVPDISPGGYRIKRDGVEQVAGTHNTTSWVAKTHDITILDSSQFLTLEIEGGERSAGDVPTSIRNNQLGWDEQGLSAVITD